MNLIKGMQALAYVMGAIFILRETARRGVDHFAINATTMLEDYGSGGLLLLAAAACTARFAQSTIYLAGAWGYSAGGMLSSFSYILKCLFVLSLSVLTIPLKMLSESLLKGAFGVFASQLFLLVCMTRQDLPVHIQ